MIRLTVIRPDRPPETVVHDKPAEIVVGRSSRCGIVLDDDPLVSRNHAAFLFDAMSARIKDLHSTNGIRVNGVFYGTDTPVNAYEPLELKNGDEAQIGSALFRITITADHDTATHVVPPPPAASRRAFLRDADASGRFGAGAMETVQGMDTPLPRVPGYRLTRYLGMGASGKVYLGVSNGDERRVAVRILYPPSGLTPDALRFFFKEFDDARHIVHPNLARLLGAGELPKGGGVFIAAEYADGHSLSGHMRRLSGGRLDAATAVGIAAQVSGALCRLHMRGMTHLDMKPESVMVRSEGGRVSAKVTDAGFTAFLEMAGLAPGMYAGNNAEKLGFLAPEQISRGREAGKATDVFALSALLFYMLTGKSPYAFGSGDNRSVVEAGRVLSPDGLSGVIPEQVAGILKKGLAANPDDRYPDACRLAEAFDALRKQ